MSLFRKEVFIAKQEKLTGAVITTQSISLYSVVFIFFLFALIAIIYLTQFSYSRKETVKGYVLPQSGMIQVYPSRVGVLGQLFVKEGEDITQGTAIAKIVNSQSLSTGVEVSDALAKELSLQIGALNEELHLYEIMSKKDNQRLETQLKESNDSLKAMKKAKLTSLKRLKLKKDEYHKNLQLRKKSYISSSQLSTSHDEYLEAQGSNDRLDQEIASILMNISTLESEKNALPEQMALKQASTRRTISELSSRLIELNNQFESIQKAPESGVIATIEASVGSRVNLSLPLLSIIPDNSPLEAELLLPTRSAGFIQVGDPVEIMVDAFPYQRFGMMKGAVSSIDQSVVLPNEKVLPIQNREAIYRVRVTLSKQTMSAYKHELSLKVGMTVKANIILEKRSLLDWLLDPLYSARGRLG